jgi:hypothetical protein
MTPRRHAGRSNAEHGDVIFEFSAIGNSVKVCAVDSRSGTEVSIVGPVNAGEQALRNNAMAKLRYVLEKKNTAPLGSRGTFA